MSSTSPVIAILNCRLPAPEEEIASGVIIIEDGIVAGTGKDFLMALPPDAILIDAERGMVGMGERDAEALGAIEIGAPADLVCRSRFGETVWAMKGGVVVYPEGMANLVIIWKARREGAIRLLMAMLARREEHMHVARSDSDASGEDIVWHFRDAQGETQRLTIRVIPALFSEPQHIFFLDPAFVRHLPEADVNDTRAHWWFYLHTEDGVFYCLPTRTLQRWLQSHASDFPLTRIQAPGAMEALPGRAIPVHQLQAAIPKMRVLMFRK